MNFILQGEFGANTEVVFVAYGYSCKIHTSCSQPLVAGDRIGPFQVIASGDRCNFNPSPTSVQPSLPSIAPPTPGPLTDGDCLICDRNNKLKLETLELKYFSEGLTSRYQTAATCTEGRYPVDTTVTFKLKNGDINVPVQEGMNFILQGEFGANTEVVFVAYGYSCKIHTSCSQPLVAGDRIGPFQVIGSRQSPPCMETLFPTPDPMPLPTPTPQPTPDPTPMPTPDPTPQPTPDPTPMPTPDPTPLPTTNDDSPTSSSTGSLPPLAIRSPAPTWMPTALPTSNPTSPPTSKPTSPPTFNPTPNCIEVDAASYQCGDPIEVTFDFAEALQNDWIGLYPCEITVYKHSIVWQWSCGGANCQDTVKSGSVTFDQLPSYNSYGPHTWPLTPFKKRDGSINRCFKAVYLRAEGPSVPPYISICASQEFTIQENGSGDCAISEITLLGQNI